jgi:lysophospholipase L1-like esterase
MKPGPPAEATPLLEEPPPPRRARFARLALQTLLGLAAGLGVAEAAFRHRDGHAHPLVNVYEADARRGVRLVPGSATVVGRRGERATHVRVNHDGYRGADWPAPAPSDVLVIGDSLSFGLGVEEDEALPARLHAALPGAPNVLDASVPTYGPPEYLVTMDQLLSRRRPGTVVIVVNLINDLAEIDRPNTGRHTALDGFAARFDPSAPPRASSPLRTRLIQQSHAAFALWRWARTREAQNANLDPEPDTTSLLPLALRVAAASNALGDHRRAEARRAADVADAEQELVAADRDIVRLVRAHRGLVAYTETWRREWDAYLKADGAPGDEVFPNFFGGCAPPPAWWYAQYGSSRNVRFAGSRIQRDVENTLQDMARGLPADKAREIRDAFARRDAARVRLSALPQDVPLPPPAPASLPIAPFLAEAQALAAAHGAKLVVIAAPLDAQIALEARRRRGITDVEAAALDVLTAEIAAAATAAGAIGIDATGALKNAGAAAFLDDGHLSPAGHDLVARAVAAALG